MNEFSSIKERIVYFIEYQGIAKESFYKKIGMNSASFRGKTVKTSINSDAIVNVLTECPEINPYWLILGKGEMLIEERMVAAEPAGAYGKRDELLETYRELLADKEKIIQLLEREIRQLRRKHGDAGSKAG